MALFLFINPFAAAVNIFTASLSYSKKDFSALKHPEIPLSGITRTFSMLK